MQIAIEHHNDQFNVVLATAAGKEPFITIKGCRLVSGRYGDFVSWPARKLESGKYWQHCYASEAFNAAVLAAVRESQPKKQQRANDEQWRAGAPADSDVPF